MYTHITACVNMCMCVCVYTHTHSLLPPPLTLSRHAAATVSAILFIDDVHPYTHTHTHTHRSSIRKPSGQSDGGLSHIAPQAATHPVHPHPPPTQGYFGTRRVARSRQLKGPTRANSPRFVVGRLDALCSAHSQAALCQLDLR